MKLNLTIQQCNDVRNAFKGYYRCIEEIKEFWYSRQDKLDLSPKEEMKLKNDLIISHLYTIKMLVEDMNKSLENNELIFKINEYFTDIVSYLNILIEEEVEDISEDDLIEQLSEISEIKNELLDEF